jgi:hypothetical protein
MWITLSRPKQPSVASTDELPDFACGQALLVEFAALTFRAASFFEAIWRLMH